MNIIDIAVDEGSTLVFQINCLAVGIVLILIMVLLFLVKQCSKYLNKKSVMINECSFVGRYPSTVDEFLSDEAFARKLWTGVLFNCKYNESGFWNLLEKIILRNMVPDVEKEDFNESLFKRIGKNIPSEHKKTLEKTDYSPYLDFTSNQCHNSPMIIKRLKSSVLNF